VPALIVRCPRCPDIHQGTSVPLQRLQEMLKSGENISVTGGVCGHTWDLSSEELKNLRKTFAANA
jgi:hypothetical protein